MNIIRIITVAISIVIVIILASLSWSCSGQLIEPIAGYSAEHPSQSQSALFVNIGEYLSAQGCTQAISLVGEHLTRTRTKWDPTISLGSGADFLPTFKLRYGIDYRDRRSPVEVETLTTTYEEVGVQIESHPETLNLPVGYRYSEQDKADLFYVMGPRGGLAIREILEPLLLVSVIDPEPTIPPVVPPITPPPVPLPATPIIRPPIAPCPDPVLTLSPESLSTLDNLTRWVIGSGRKSKVNKLVREVKDKMNTRSTGQVNVIVVPPS